MNMGADLPDGLQNSPSCWLEAVEQADLDGYVDLVTDDVVWIPPGQEALQGRTFQAVAALGTRAAHSTRPTAAGEGEVPAHPRFECPVADCGPPVAGDARGLAELRPSARSVFVAGVALAYVGWFVGSGTSPAKDRSAVAPGSRVGVTNSCRTNVVNSQAL